MIAFLRRHYRTLANDLPSFLDTWNGLTLGTILLLTFLIFLGDLVVEQLPKSIVSQLPQIPTTQKLLVLLTAAYVLTSFNQMRELRKNRPNHEASPVLPYFENYGARGFKVLKMRNFGSSPVVMFQLLARVAGIEDPWDVRRIKSHEDPVNLDPGQSVILMDSRLARELETRDEWPDNAELQIYYGFDSVHAGDAPHAAGLGKSLDDLEIEYPSPKSIKMQELQSCFEDSRTKASTEGDSGCP